MSPIPSGANTTRPGLAGLNYPTRQTSTASRHPAHLQGGSAKAGETPNLARTSSGHAKLGTPVRTDQEATTPLESMPKPVPSDVPAVQQPPGGPSSQPVPRTRGSQEPERRVILNY